MEYAFAIWMLAWAVVIQVALFREVGRREEIRPYRTVFRAKSIAMIVFFTSGAVSLFVPEFWSGITGWIAFIALAVNLSSIWVFRVVMHKRLPPLSPPESTGLGK